MAARRGSPADTKIEVLHADGRPVERVWLQAVRNSERVVREMLRVGRQGIVTFPNFGYWRHRIQSMAGHMPVSDNLPYQWYDTPNIRVATYADFEALVHEKGLHLQKAFGLHEHEIVRVWPNLLATTAVFQLTLPTRR